MIKPNDLFNLLREKNVNCFCGVPDSLLKDFCAYVTDNTTEKEHTITANEGNAIALACGHYLATGNPALVYMQNSGIGNCVNPLLSLIDREVYNIPLLMFIGWRGEPNKKDEPQHIKQGKITDKLLETMGIKYTILDENFNNVKEQINDAFEYMKESSCPYAFIIKKGTFEKYSLINKKQNSYTLKRENAIETVIKYLNCADIIVSTTGHISREIYEIRERLGQTHKQDFLTIGSMGHSSSIALGIALEKSNRNVYCFDGDGAFLMHTGAIVVNASKHLNNFKHIVLNNEAHDSVGSQPTAINNANLTQIAKNAGYKEVYSVVTQEELEDILPEFINNNSTSLLEIKVKCATRDNLGRPKEKPLENKNKFMENINQIEFIYKGATENLSKILQIEQTNKALIFTGKKSFELIKPIIENKLQNINITYYNKFSTNPKKEDIDIAINQIHSDFDIIIAIGGGSVIDFAKAYRYYTDKNKKLIAIPTTAGTGSEATQFAVIYENGIKKSLDEKSILPNYTIVDSQFVENNPKYLKACTSIDAFCHAIESYWAVRSTPKSAEYAKQAMELCRDNIVQYVNSAEEIYAKNMMLASNMAGKAINISRTTAAHALSYAITSQYGLPHGHAVALSMIDLFNANKNITENNYIGTREMAIIKENIEQILNIIGAKNFELYWKNLTKNIGIELNCKHLNINDKSKLIKFVNIDRLNNNPKDLTKDLPHFYKCIVIICLILLVEQPAHAYVDPGTGSMLFSIVISIVGVLFFFISSVWEKVKLYFFKSTTPNTQTPIVIYTESKRYYHVFNDVINEFEKREYPLVVYVTDEDDEFLNQKYKFVKVKNIGKGNKAFSKLAFMKADVCLMTTPGLDVYQLKRSKHVKHYSHLLHCLSECLSYRLFGIDYFDSVLMNFDKSEQYIRKLENKRNLKQKELVVVGSPYMDSMLKNLPQRNNLYCNKTILLAPSWGASAILANFGTELIEQLSKTSFNIIVRPHPQSLISEKMLIQNLQKKFKNCKNIQWDFSNDNLQTMANSDILITDFSSIIYEFLFLFNKPVIYSLSSYNKDLYDISDIDEETYRIQIMDKLATELKQENINDIENIINSLLNSQQLKNDFIEIKNTIWQEQGKSAKNVVDFLINKQKEVSKC